jgi:tRNA (adenine22-N1)-methyltransferase
MGGQRMIELLANTPTVTAALTCLVLQPNNGDELVRRWLVDHGWTLADERLIVDRGRVYAIIRASSTHDPNAALAPSNTWSADDWKFGPNVLRRGGPALCQRLREEINYCRRAQDAVTRALSAPPARAAELADTRARLERLLARATTT